MKYILIASLFLFSSINLFAKDTSEFKKTAAGVGFMFGNQPNSESFSVELKKHELLNDNFLIGFDTFISATFDDASAGIISVKPSVGFFAFGDSNSKFKTIISVSSGLAVTSYESTDFEDDQYFGTFSAIDLHLIYKSYGLTLTGYSVNTGNYYNSGGNIGIKYWF